MRLNGCFVMQQLLYTAVARLTGTAPGVVRLP